MEGFFNFFGSIFGYVLWAAFQLVSNFGVAIIIFTLVFKVILFPSSVKQQKSMAANAKLQLKQKELQKKYANNKQKYNEELQKLYEKENVKPFGGCLTSLLPMFVMLGIFYSVRSPITNVLHIAADKVQALEKFIYSIPGVMPGQNSFYKEIDILGLFDKVSSQEGVTNILTGDEIDKISSFSSGFDFAGINLLETPKVAGGILFLIPILCFVTSIGTQLFTMYMKGSPMKNQQGCMKYMMIALPLFTAWIAYTVPAAVGFYWICSNLLGFVQTIVMNKFYSPDLINAKSEAAHIARLELEEANIK